MKHDNEFKNRVIQAVTGGMTREAAAKEFRVSAQTVSNWVRVRKGTTHAIARTTRAARTSRISNLPIQPDRNLASLRLGAQLIQAGVEGLGLTQRDQ